MAKIKQNDLIRQINKDIKDRNFKPIYFLTGDEPHYIDTISELIENSVLEESEREFNQVVIYGSDTSVPEIISSAKRFPMMSEYQVVIVREAQGIQGFNTESSMEMLAEYSKNPMQSTVLVFNYKYKKLDARKTFAKNVKKNGVYFESKKLYENEIPDWITAVLKGKGYQIEQKAVYMLVEFLGNDLGKIAKELEKLESIIPRSTMITPDHIEANIGISKDFNNFELNSALTKKDVLKANRIISYFADNPKEHPILGTLPLLYSFFTKILIYHTLKDKSQSNAARELKVNPFFVQEYVEASRNYDLKKAVRIIGYLREADIRAKGVGANQMPSGEILKELIFKILH